MPDIKTFIQSLDRDKRARDQQLDESNKTSHAKSNEARPHQATNAGKEGTLKTVHDPTTGREVQIEDVDANFMKSVKEPQVRYSYVGFVFSCLLPSSLAISTKCKSW